MTSTATALAAETTPASPAPSRAQELLARAKAALEAGQDIDVPADDLRPWDGQPRKHFDGDQLKRLGQAIAAVGQTSPGIIRENPGTTRYEIVDGERRWRAISGLPPETRPAYRARLIQADDEVVRYLISGISNFNRAAHTPLETAEMIDRLVSMGMPMGEIAPLIGVSEHWASQIHNLVKLVPPVQAMLDPDLPRQQQLPVTAAVEIGKMIPRLQEEMARRVVTRDVPVARVREAVVTVSSRAGAPVRTRTRLPLEEWKLVPGKVDRLKDHALDLRHVLKDPNVQRVMRGHGPEAKKALTAIRAARAALAEVEAILA